MEVAGTMAMLGEEWTEFHTELHNMDADDVYESTLSLSKSVGTIVAKAIDL